MTPPALPLYLGWQADPVLLGGLLSLAVSYGLAVGPLRSRLAPGVRFPLGRALWFYGGLALMFLVEGSPLHDLAERYLFSAHMAQHLLLSYLVAPMLLAGAPAWILRPLLLSRVVGPIARVLTNPVTTFFTFTLLFSLWHVPAIYEGALRNSTLHHGEHLVFLATALMLWWPLMSPLPELPRPPAGVQLIYLFALPIAQLPVFATVTFADGPLYATYAAAPRVFFGDALADQIAGGALMKVVGLLAFGIPFAVVFFRWYAADMAQPAGVRRVRRPS